LKAIERWYWQYFRIYGPLKSSESPTHQTHGRSPFANGRSYPLDASGADIAYSEYSWKAAFAACQADGKDAKKEFDLVHSQWQIAAGEDEALIRLQLPIE
jgi:hypothetical protein